METRADDQDHLVYDNANEDIGYESEEYYVDDQADGNNNSDRNVVKRGITRLSKFHNDYGKTGGIKLSVTFDAMDRISGSNRALFASFLGDLVREHIGLKILSWKKRYFDVDEIVRKLIMHRLGGLLWNFIRKLRQRYILPNQNTPSKLNELPAKYSAIVTASEWVAFVKYMTTEEYQGKSLQQKWRVPSLFISIRWDEVDSGYVYMKEKMMKASKSSVSVNYKMQRLKATMMMIAAELIIAAFSVCYKLASDDGMRMSVLISYRYLFASILIFPLAFFIERKKRPKLTWTILFQAFLCAIFGGPMSQNLYAESLVLTSATFVAAFTNLVPPFTFIIALLFRLEKVEIGNIIGKMKVIGTLVGVGGAMLLTFYKGQQLNIWSTHFNLLHGGQNVHVASTHKTSTHHILGSLLALAYSLSIALYFTLQSKMSANYPCHYSSTFLFSVIGFIQSFVYALSTERSWSQWKLGWNIRLFFAIFQGITSLLAVFLVMAAIHLQGPLFVSVFNPLMLVFVGIAGFLVLDEKLHVGTVLGSIIIIMGLYLVLWGKSKEAKTLSKQIPSGNAEDVNDHSNSTTMMTPETQSMAGSIDELQVKFPREKLQENER